MTRSRHINRTSLIALLLLPAFFATGYVVLPLFSIFGEAASGRAGAFRFLLTSATIEATLNSIFISFLSVAGSAMLGTFLAAAFHFLEIPFRKFFSLLVLVPLALPPLVGVMSFLFLIGESGFLTRTLSMVFGGPPQSFALGGWWGIVLVHVYSFYVYFYLFVSAGLTTMDHSSLEASASLGAGRWRTVRSVLMPMLRPSLFGASLITFMASMASFTAPLLFGGPSRFLTLEIYIAKLNGEDSRSAVLSLLLALVSLLLFLFARRYHSGELAAGAKGAARTSIRRQRGILRLAGATAAIIIALLLTLPVAVIVLLSFVREGSWTYQFFPSVFSFENYFRIFADSNVARPFLNSLWMAAAASGIVLLLGLTTSYLSVRRRMSSARLIESILSLPFGIPGTVIAVGFILAFSHPSPFSFGTVLVGTAWILPLAYAVREMPLLLRSSAAGFESVDRSVEEAAITLGSSAWRTVRRILAPLILPSVVSGSLLVFINSVGEFVSSVLLYSYGNRPVSVEILSQLRLYNVGSAAAYGVLLMILVLLVAGIARRWSTESVPF